MKKLRLLSTCMMTLVVMLASSAAFSKHEHVFRNFSSQPWTILYTGGNSEFFDSTCRKNSLCVVQPGQVVWFKAFAQNVYITDSVGLTKSFHIGWKDYIEHRGSTGAIALNDPGKGDITAVGDVW